MLGTGLAATALVAGCDSVTKSSTQPAEWRENLRLPPRDTHLQIIAHPDDDLFFFNPDLLYAIRAFNRTVTVCLTGGEADGKNLRGGLPGRESAPVNYADYVAARYNGLRAAYAQAVVGDRNSLWQRETMATADGALAERDTLKAAPHIQLIFLCMWQEGARGPSGKAGRLRTLWSGETASQPTIRPTGAPVPDTYAYRRKGLIMTLVDILQAYRPTVVRTMDPDPDHLVHDAANPQWFDYGDFTDHADHTPAGLFAWAALHEWWRRGDGDWSVVESYRGYYHRRWPAPLSRSSNQEKLDLIRVYGWADGRDCGDPAGCGDQQIGDLRTLKGGDGQGTAHRYGVTPDWLQRGADGRLAAFAVLGGQAAMWIEAESRTDEWDGPQLLGGGPLLPHVAAAQTPDGRWHVFGVRMTLDADDAKQRRDLVTAVQKEPGGDFGAWTSLGNPNDQPGEDPVNRRGIGMPVLAVHADGRLRVFVRNFGAGVSTRVRNRDGWGPWQDLGGNHTQDGLAVAAGIGGRIEVFASAKTGVMRWYQERADGDFQRTQLTVPAPAGPPAMVRRADGRLVLLVRQADTANVVAYEQGTSGSWGTKPVMLGGDGGFGPVSAVTCGRFIAIAQRNDNSTISVSLRDGSDLAKGAWEQTGPQFLHAPSAGVDRTGRLVVAALSTDGLLRVTRQEMPGPSSRLRPWAVAGRR